MITTRLTYRSKRRFKVRRRPLRRQLRLEHFEDRTVPSTVTWTGGPTGMGTNWLDASNWQDQATGLNHVPGPTDDAVIAEATGDQPSDINLAGAATIHSATVSRALHLTAGTLEIGPATSSFNDLVLEGGVLAPLDGATIDSTLIEGSGTISNPAGHSLVISNSATYAAVDNAGSLSAVGNDYLYGGLTMESGSTLTVQYSGADWGTSLYVAGDLTSLGTINLTGTNGPPATTDLNVGGRLTNVGTMTVTGAGVFSLEGAVDNQGTFSVGGNTTWWSSGASTNSGTIAVAPGSTLTVNGGSFTNTGGTLTGGTFDFAGACSLGTTTVDGSLASTGTLFVKLNGTQPGSKNDQVRVTGTVTLGGRLDVGIGYTAAPGDTFVIVDNAGTGPVIGTFAGLPQGGVFEVNGQVFTISYTGGTGNDVTVTCGVPAGVSVWDGGLNGMGDNWLDPANWVGDVLPGSTNDAVIGPAMGNQPTAISLSGDAAIHTATVHRSLLGGGNGSLTLRADGSTFAGMSLSFFFLYGPGGFTNAAGDTMTLGGPTLVTAPLVNHGTLDVVRGYGTSVLAGPFVNAADGVVNVDAGALAVPPGFTNYGDVELVGGSYPWGGPELGGGPMINEPGGQITTQAYQATLALDINNQGTMTTNCLTDLGGAFVNSGTFEILGGQVFATVLNFSKTLTNTGTIKLDGPACELIVSPGKFTNLVGGVLTGGTYNLAGRLSIWGGEITTLAADLKLDGPYGSVPNDQAPNYNGLSNLRTISSAGRLNLAGGNNLTVLPTLANAGTIVVGDGSTLTAAGGLTNTGTVAGSGTIAGNVSGGGAISPAGEGVGVLTVNGNLSGVGLAVDLNGTAAGTEYDQLVAKGGVSLDGPLTVNPGYAVAQGDSFVVVDNDGTDPVVGTFDGLPEGATFTGGGQFFRISYVGGTGNDVVLIRSAPVAPIVQSFVVNDGTAQRSRVTSLTVTFDTQMDFAGPVATAFSLTRTDDGAAVAFTATVNQVRGETVVTLTGFTGPASEYGSLADGSYTLTALAGQISANGLALDGNGDGTGGDNYVFGASQGLWRLFGDGNVDHRVDAADYMLLQQTLNHSAGDPQFNAAFDANGDGVVDSFDASRFMQAYLAAPPVVTGTQVNDGSAQRSRVTSLQVSFSRTVSFAGAVAGAFTLTRDSDGAAVFFSATAVDLNGATVVTLTGFAGAASNFGSLADGKYTLTALAGQISGSGLALDGNGDGTTGDNYALGSAQGLFRLFGDVNGDRRVDGSDLEQLRQTFNRNVLDSLYLAALDYNGDGVVDAQDVGAFRVRYGHGI